MVVLNVLSKLGIPINIGDIHVQLFTMYNICCEHVGNEKGKCPVQKRELTLPNYNKKIVGCI